MATNATAAAVTAPPMVIARMTMNAFSDESDPRSSATWSPRSHAASVVAASDGAGRSAATSYLGRIGKDTITSYTVDETDTATSVTIHIHVTVPTVIPLPGFTPSADVTVTRGKERFTTPDSP